MLQTMSQKEPSETDMQCCWELQKRPEFQSINKEMKDQVEKKYLKT